MAYTRNSGTTLGAACNHLIIVDQGGSSVVDLGSTGSTPVVNASCTYTTVTWNGVSRGALQTNAPGSVTFQGITWASGNPTLTHAAANGAGFFIAMALGPIDTTGYILQTSDYGNGVKRASSSGALIYMTGQDNDNQTIGSTFGSSYADRVCYMGYAKQGGNEVAISDIDGGSKAALDLNIAEPGYVNSGGSIQGIGGWTGQGAHAIRLLCVAVFNNRALSLADFQTLRADWFSTLVSVSASGSVLTRSGSVMGGGMGDLSGGMRN